MWFKGLSSLLTLKLGFSVNWSKGHDCDQMLNILSPSVFPHLLHSLYLNTKSEFPCVSAPLDLEYEICLLSFENYSSMFSGKMQLLD